MGRPKVFDTERIREDFINGHASLRASAGTSGASYSYLSKLASSERWTERRKEKRVELAKSAAERLAQSGGGAAGLQPCPQQITWNEA